MPNPPPLRRDRPSPRLPRRRGTPPGRSGWPAFRLLPERVRSGVTGFAGEGHVLGDGHRGEELHPLEGASQTTAGAGGGTELRDVTSEEHDPPGVGPQESTTGVERGGLAGAVGTDE